MKCLLTSVCGPRSALLNQAFLVLSITTPTLTFSFWSFLLHIKLSAELNTADAQSHCFQLRTIYEGTKAEMCLSSARCGHYCSRRGQCGERGGRKGKKVWSGRGVQEDGEESAPLSGCQIPAGMLACQLSRLRRPAEMIMGLCGLAVLPLTDYCNAIIGVQMGPCLSAQPGEHQSLQVIYSHGRLLPSHDGTERLQHGYRLPIQS